MLDLGRALGRYITHYRNSYFNQTGYGGFTWVPRAGAKEEIYEKLKPLVLRMSAADYHKQGADAIKADRLRGEAIERLLVEKFERWEVLDQKADTKWMLFNGDSAEVMAGKSSGCHSLSGLEYLPLIPLKDSRLARRFCAT